jgi:hypothetical protein
MGAARMTSRSLSLWIVSAVLVVGIAVVGFALSLSGVAP